MEKGLESRFNVPGTTMDSNWSWRFTSDELTTDIAKKLAKITTDSSRATYE